MVFALNPRHSTQPPHDEASRVEILPVLKPQTSFHSFAVPENGLRVSRGLVLVLLIHLCLFFALKHGMIQEVAKWVEQPVEAVLVEEQVKPAPPPPPPPVKQPLPFVPPPVASVASDAPSSTHSISVSNDPVPQATVPAPAPPVKPVAPPPVERTPAVVNAAQCEKPEYPASSKKLDEQGTVLLRFLISEQGKVNASEVVTSSGYKRLDEAARLALAKCSFKPATVGGIPEQAWATLKYTWRLDE